VRYVDAVFVVVHKDGVLDLLTLLNSQHESIKFNYEMEKDDKMPILDVEIRRNDNKEFIMNESHHSVLHKMAAFNSMLHRAMSIPLTIEDRRLSNTVTGNASGRSPL
jgi:hypothetical protein